MTTERCGLNDSGVEHPQPSRFSASTRKPETLPCQPEAAPIDLVSNFPEMSLELPCQNLRFP